MALSLALVVAAFISITSSSYISCRYSSNNCRGSSSTNIKTVNAGSNAIVCWDMYSCRYSRLTSTANINAYGLYSASYSTITAPRVLARGNGALQSSTVTATTSVQLDSYATGSGATITAPLVYLYGYITGINADITADTVIIKGYQGGVQAKITATKVDITGEKGGQTVDFKPKNGKLDITFNAYQAGYNTDILCQNGEDCTVECKTPDSCYNVKLYCVGGGDCKVTYNQRCEDGSNIYCVSVSQSGVGGLTDDDIYELYRKNKARRDNPIEPFNDDYPNGPDEPPYSPSVPTNDYYLSFSNGQFVVLCLLMALFITILSVSCIYTMKTAKKTGFRVVEKEDFQ